MVNNSLLRWPWVSERSKVLENILDKTENWEQSEMFSEMLLDIPKFLFLFIFFDILGQFFHSFFSF